MSSPNSDTSPDEAEADEALEVLFSSDRADSIVDSLFGLPGDAAPDAGGGPLERAVFNRLQARLAARMRRLIDEEKPGEDERSAA